MARVVLAKPGCKLGISKGYLVVRNGSSPEVKIPLNDVDEIIVSSRGVLISSNLIMELALLGIPLYLVRGDGSSVSMLWPTVPNKTVITRRAQYEVVVNGLAIEYAKEFVAAKIHNKAWLLKYLGKSRRRPDIRDCGYLVDDYVSRACSCGDTKDLINVEAEASRKYWRCYAELVSNAGFTFRDQDGTDPVNLSLNYGYGILKSLVLKSIVIAGLDPYAGFLHVDKSGRPSLILDFMEPFRFVVDKAVAELVARYVPEVVDGMLSRESRRVIADKVLRVINEDYYSYGNLRRSIADIIKSQARELASSIRSKTVFKAFRVRW